MEYNRDMKGPIPSPIVRRRRMACLRERVVLAQNRDRRLQGADRLEHVLLLRVELGQLLLAKGRRLVERLLVLRDLGLPLTLLVQGFEANHRRAKPSQQDTQCKDAREEDAGSESRSSSPRVLPPSIWRVRILV